MAGGKVERKPTGGWVGLARTKVPKLEIGGGWGGHREGRRRRRRDGLGRGWLAVWVGWLGGKIEGKLLLATKLTKLKFGGVGWARGRGWGWVDSSNRVRERGWVGMGWAELGSLITGQ